MSSPFKMMYNAFIDDTHCEEPSATLCEPQMTQVATMQSHSELTDQGYNYVAAISPLPNTAVFNPFWELHHKDFEPSHLHAPKSTRPPRTPIRKHRHHPYPSRAPRWETPAAIAPSVGFTPATFPSWDQASYNSDLGFSYLHPQALLSTQPLAEGIFACCAPHPDAASHEDDDLFRQLAASISASATVSPSLNSSEPSSVYGESYSSSSAALDTPPSAAGDVQGGISGEADQVEAPQSDMAVVPNPAITVTNHVHSQQDAASGVATTVGSVVLPFPANRDDLLDLLQQGLHLQCIMPSVRHHEKHIVCLGKHRLQGDGRFVGVNKVCGKSFSSEDLYGRHVKVVHVGMDSKRAAGSLDIENWIHRIRPGVAILKGDPRRVVQGARAKAMDLRVRRRSRRESEGTSNYPA